jgi:hypothetical protein
MITNQNRSLYKRFNLPKSYSKVWSAETLVYYAEQVKQKRELPKAYQDVEDDPHQLGGNYILQFNEKDDRSNEGLLFRTVFSYPSKNPPDRPSASQLLEFLATLS